MAGIESAAGIAGTVAAWAWVSRAKPNLAVGAVPTRCLRGRELAREVSS
jgi:hypothetical protein